MPTMLCERIHKEALRPRRLSRHTCSGKSQSDLWVCTVLIWQASFYLNCRFRRQWNCSLNGWASHRHPATEPRISYEGELSLLSHHSASLTNLLLPSTISLQTGPTYWQHVSWNSASVSSSSISSPEDSTEPYSSLPWPSSLSQACLFSASLPSNANQSAISGKAF